MLYEGKLNVWLTEYENKCELYNLYEQEFPEMEKISLNIIEDNTKGSYC